MASTTSEEVIRKLKAHFERYGVPKVIITDGGPKFTSRESTDFTQRWGIHHQISDPGYPKTNGKAEAAVKIMKNLMIKVQNNGNDPYESLLEHTSPRL